MTLKLSKKNLNIRKKDFNLFKTYKDNFLRNKQLTEDINRKSYFYLKNKSSDLITKRDALKKELEELNQNILSLEAENKNIKEKLSPYKKDYNNEKERLDKLIANFTSYEKNIDKSNSSLKLNEQKIDYDQKDRDRIGEILASLETNYKRENEKLSENEIKLNSLIEAVTEAEKNLSYKIEIRDKLENEIKILNEEIFKEKISHEYVEGE